MEKNTIKKQKILAKAKRLRYTTNCCGMIAMKREVAAYGRNIWQVFRGANVKLGNWRQVTVQRYDPRVSHTVKQQTITVKNDV